MIKHTVFTILKGIFPLLIYYLLVKLTASDGSFLNNESFQEILGMAFYYSLGPVIVDILIQAFLYFILFSEPAATINKSFFVQGILFNIPLCLIWIYGFSEMGDPNIVFVLASFIISSIIAGLLYSTIREGSFWKVNKS